MIDVDKCTVRQTECVHFLQINGKHDIFVFIFHHYQGESQPTIAVKLWYEVILFASELVFFLPESVMFDCTLRDYGPEATVKSFGIPDYPGDHYGDGTRTTERSYHLNLEVRLHNGAMKTFEFDVTDQVKAQPRGGVIIVSDGLVITDEEGAAGSDSGFDIDVEGWGDYIDIPLPL